MTILLISSAKNSLSVRALIELQERGHMVELVAVQSEKEIETYARKYKPELIICPYLLVRVPKLVWESCRTIIIHPGIAGDRGPSSLDWAILNGEKEWGVTAIQANDEFDAGGVWAERRFPMEQSNKTTLYRNKITKAAIEVILEVVTKATDKNFSPKPQSTLQKNAIKRRPIMRQVDRTIHWESDTTEVVLRKLCAANTQPGVHDPMFGGIYLYGGGRESELKGSAGEVLMFRNSAMCVGTVDGAVWITHVKRMETNTVLQKFPSIKLPAQAVLGSTVPAVKNQPYVGLPEKNASTAQEIWYEEENQVGYLHFDFYNGAMGTSQAGRLMTAYFKACTRDIKVLVLMGGANFWSNGINLNLIEAAEKPEREAMKNLYAINQLVRFIITTCSKLTVASLWGSAGAGGAIIPLAADRVVASRRCILHPFYKEMGLHGSEYWTYLLLKRVGSQKASELMNTPTPLGVDEALRIGYIDQIFSEDEQEYLGEVRAFAEDLAHGKEYGQLLEMKTAKREEDESEKPLSNYNNEEAAEMAQNFSGKKAVDGILFPEARKKFVYKMCR